MCFSGWVQRCPTLLSMSFFPTADWRACSRASTNPSHSLSLRRASAPSELTFLREQKADTSTHLSVSMREACKKASTGCSYTPLTGHIAALNLTHNTPPLQQQQQQLQFLQPFCSRWYKCLGGLWGRDFYHLKFWLLVSTYGTIY